MDIIVVLVFIVYRLPLFIVIPSFKTGIIIQFTAGQVIVPVIAIIIPPHLIIISFESIIIPCNPVLIFLRSPVVVVKLTGCKAVPIIALYPGAVNAHFVIPKLHSARPEGFTVPEGFNMAAISFSLITSGACPESVVPIIIIIDDGRIANDGEVLPAIDTMAENISCRNIDPRRKTPVIIRRIIIAQ